jgi:tRNA(Ile)-lysidine synthase
MATLSETWMYKKIVAFSNQYDLIPDNTTIIIGLSGGPDSVFLLYFLKHLQKEKNLTLIAAHLNHEWRADAQKDEQFCSRLAENLEVDYVSDIASNFSTTEKFDGSKEEFARRLRRKFFNSVAEVYHAQVIALGHHLDDQEETFFIRLIRGSSLSGLTCMKPKDGPYVRPLLEVLKKDIVAWLDEHHCEYLIDPTNVSQEFLRNRIRAHVIPALRDSDVRFDKNFLSTLLKLQDADSFLEQLTDDIYKAISQESGLNIKHLLSFDPYIQKRLLIKWLINANVQFTPQDAFFNEIIRFLQQPGNKTHAVHNAWCIKKMDNIAFIEQ